MGSEQRKGGTELGRFLRARRTQVTPAQVGLPIGPGIRRTPGLRREEIATLAGVSIDYYIRLERGTEYRPSPAVVDALARALLLDEVEHEHLRDLVSRADARPTRAPAVPDPTLSPGVELLLESLRPNPAHIVDRSMQVLAANPAAQRLYPGLHEWPADQRNTARYVFLHPAARSLFDDWDGAVRGCVARLRALAGTEPDAPDLAKLVGELLLKSPEFSRIWEQYEVKGSPSGRKVFHHPEVGEFGLGFQSMLLEGTPGHRLVTYFAEPGTPDHDAMVLLDMAGAQERAESEAQKKA